MSNISPRPEQSTTTEAELLTSINELSNSAAGEFIRKAEGVFVNATPGATSVSFIDLTDTPANYTDAANKTLKVNAGGDAIEFVDVAAGATTALSNLDSVAINTSLISDTTNTDDLGSSTKLWKDLFVTNIGATATRVTKGWFTDLEITNLPTINGGTLATALSLGTAAYTDDTDYATASHNTQHAVGGTDTVFPADPGSDKFLMWDDDPGALVWADAGASGATTALDNLASVAINTSLIPGADVSVNMGTGDLRYKDMWVETISSGLTAGDTLKLRGRDIDNTTYIDILTITSNNTVTADLNAITTIGGNAIIYSGGALGTPSGGTLTNCSGLPVSGITDSTSEALGVGSLELGHASDTTISRSAAGVLAVEGTAIPKGTGTSNEIAYWSGTNTLGTLATATYPSLTELSYVKGVTSAIQTQIGNKANSASPTFTGTITLADNCRIDLTLPTADGYVTGPTTDSFNAGYSSAVGDLVFFGTGGKWLEADADAIATCGSLLGIALEAKTDGQAMKVALPGSMVRIDAWNWNVGKALYAGETLGALSESIPTGADGVVRVVGFSLNADTIYFNPSSDHSTTVA